ncbi:leucine-rich repeat domain-containing protein [Gimesia maris]|uniref:Internalin-A n=1 Tax=Gimesia maris TaxID=122 RepID=A0ABX5YM81_9PLAN|nr:hypothetical protein [Gimesia maris]QEG16772.1 Internalin-A precursor [Gimesia maris]QGQ30070.1 hypothetical protein F1729_16265 [Gimesia maris]
MSHHLLIPVCLTLSLLGQTADLSACENCIKKQTVAKLEQKIKILEGSGAPEQVIEQARKKLLEMKKLVVKEKKSILGYDAVSREFFVFLDGSLKQASGPWLDPQEILEMKTPFVNYSGPGIKVGNARWGAWDEAGNWRWYYREIDQKDVLNPNILKSGELPPWFIEDQRRAKRSISQSDNRSMTPQKTASLLSPAVSYLKHHKFFQVEFDNEENPRRITIKAPYTNPYPSKSEVRLAEIDFTQLRGLDGLRSLTLEGVNLYGRAEGLGFFPRLEALTLINTNISDQDRGRITTFTQLKTLRLENVHLGRHLNDLSTFRKLEKLALRNCGLDEDDVATLGSLTQLRELDLSGNSSLNDVALFHLRNLNQLEELKVASYYNRITEKGLQYLRQPRKLKTLDLIGCMLKADGLAAIGDVSSLETLNLKVYCPERVDAHFFDPLRHLKSLRELTLECRQLKGGEGLSSLSQLPELEALHLLQTKLQDEDIRWIANCNSLKALTLNSYEVTDQGVSSLGSLKQLESLNLDRCRLDGSGLVSLQQLHRLTDVSLNHTGVTDAVIPFLSSLSQLKRLTLENGRVSSATLESLKDLKKLSELNLTNCPVSDEICELLTQMSALRTLNLNKTKVSNIGLEGLQKATGLETLSLRRTKVTRQGVQQLRTVLADCQITF